MVFLFAIHNEIVINIGVPIPRIRYLKPEFFSDENLADISLEGRLTYAGLWCYADKEGRLEDRPKYLKAMIFPYDNIDFEKQLEVLSKPKATNGIPFIIRYETQGLKLIQILNWNKHQKPHPTEKNSTLPPIPPLKEKTKIMGKGMGKQHEGSTGLSNVLITVKDPLKKTDGYNCPLFIRFWNVYPKKIGKGKAWDEWNKITVKKDESLIVEMIRVINQFKTTEQWKKDGGQYIPNPATWLHQNRWDDEIEIPTTQDQDGYEIIRRPPGGN